MIKRFLHYILGCYTTEEPVGYGYGVWNRKKNKPSEITKDRHSFYKCDYCENYVPEFKIRLKRRKE